MRKHFRVRSISGSHTDNELTMDYGSTHSIEPIANLDQNVENQTNCQIPRRRRRSTGSELPILTESQTNLVTSSCCPSCGYSNLNKDDLRFGQRHDLNCLQTDHVVRCPMDNCTYACLDRSDLSNHLTKLHFPQSRNPD